MFECQSFRLDVEEGRARAIGVEGDDAYPLYIFPGGRSSQPLLKKQ